MASSKGSSKSSGSSKSWSGTFGWVKVSYSTSWGKTTYNVWGKTYNSASSAAAAIKNSSWYSKGGNTTYTTSSWKTYTNQWSNANLWSSWSSWSYGSSGSSGTNWASKYANNKTYNSLVKQYWADNVHNALNYIEWWGSDKNQIKSIVSGWSGNNANNSTLSAISNMKFGKDVYNAGNYNLTSRNAQIADLMKQNWVKITDADSVKSFLEKYSASYKDSSDEDKNNTAQNIYNMYWEYYVDNDSPINDVTDNETPSEWEEYDVDDLFWEIFWEDEWIEGEESPVDDQDEWRQKYEDLLYEREQEKADRLEDSIDWLSNKEGEDTEKKWLTDAEKEANTAASNAAWNVAQWQWETTPEASNQPMNEQTVVNSEEYWDRWTKIMNLLNNLWYKIESAPTEQWEVAETSNILEGWQPQESAEQQAAIAESNETEWEVTPEYTDEAWLVTSYDKAFDDLLAGWSTPENIDKVIKTYLQAKDAAALFTVQNNLSDEAYRWMLKRIKSNKSLRTLLKNYNK